MEQNETPQSGKPVITEVIVKAQINVALTKGNQSLQKVQDAISEIVFNEDNLQLIADYITKLNDIDKTIELTHKDGKAPSLAEGRAWDAGKNGMLAITASLKKQLMEPYNKLCADIDKRKQDALKEKERVSSIKTGIENNVIDFSNKIAQCDTNEQLLSVERNINLEKSDSRKNKYGEFHQEAIDRYDSMLIPMIKSQKEKIKQKESLKKELEEAEKQNDASKVDELKGKQEKIDNEILQNQVDVQQNALSQMSSGITPAEELFPKIKPVNTIGFEIHDLGVAVKKCKDLLDVSIKYRECQKVAMALKDAGTFDNKDEVIVNGIKFFVDKKYKV